jgi:hypothetical protein
VGESLMRQVGTGNGAAGRRRAPLRPLRLELPLLSLFEASTLERMARLLGARTRPWKCPALLESSEGRT